MLIVVNRPRVESFTISSRMTAMTVRKGKMMTIEVGKSNLRSYKEESNRIVSNKKRYLFIAIIPLQSQIYDKFFLKQHVLSFPILNNKRN